MTATERRQHARVEVPGALRGSVHLRDDVQIINLTPAGGLIEHGARLSPGQTCVLLLPLRGAIVHLRAEVVWSQVKRIQRSPGMKSGIRFRSGIRFSEPPRAERAHLQEYFATLSPLKPTPPEAPEKS